jgi:pimeloyl-ACP methyl ester carboxylesterase
MMLPSQLKKVRLNGVDLHYLEAGTGDPLVLVHGAGPTDYRTWTPVVDRLAERYRVIAPSLRYHCPNEWVGDGLDYALETHVRDIAALITILDLAPAHIAGSSVGANIALELARDFPHLLRTMILGEPDLNNWLDEITAPACGG